MFGYPKKRHVVVMIFLAIRPAPTQDFLPFTTDDATGAACCEASPRSIVFANGKQKPGSLNRDVVTPEKEAQSSPERFRFSEISKQPDLYGFCASLPVAQKLATIDNVLPSKKMNHAKPSSHGYFVDDVVPHYQTIRFR